MKLSFFSQLLLDTEKTGIGWCADNLVKELSNYKDNKCELDFFAIRHITDKIKIYSSYVDSGCSLNSCKFFSYVLYKMLWNFIPIPYYLFFGKKNNIHLFFNYVIPPGVKGKRIAFIYDMAYKSCPETVYIKTRKWLNISMPSTIRRADKIVTISQFSKIEIMKYFKFNEDDIIVIPMGVNRILYHNNYTEVEINCVKEKFKLEGEYFLYLGTLEPRKNIVSIIEAYHVLQTERGMHHIPKLVLAGRKGWMYEEIFEKVKSYGLENNVIFTGYVEEQEAPILMKGAMCFLFPSVYEGFGMPPLEAMACGTPVITSNTSALPEVVGSAGIQVDPHNSKELGDAMLLLLDNPEKRKSLSQMGITQADKFSWKIAADILMNEFRKIEEEK